MQDPGVCWGPDQQDGRREKGVSGDHGAAQTCHLDSRKLPDSLSLSLSPPLSLGGPEIVPKPRPALSISKVLASCLPLR